MSTGTVNKWLAIMSWARMCWSDQVYITLLTYMVCIVTHLLWTMYKSRAFVPIFSIIKVFTVIGCAFEQRDWSEQMYFLVTGLSKCLISHCSLSQLRDVCFCSIWNQVLCYWGKCKVLDFLFLMKDYLLYSWREPLFLLHLWEKAKACYWI